MAAYFEMGTMLIFCFVFLCSFHLDDGARLSDPKVLLPYHSSVITNFTLKINLTREESRSPSCYTWRSSRLDVATVQLINSTDNDCALSADISAVSKSPNRKTSIVIAENKVTGEVLKCIVIVDTLQRVEIETTTRLLYLEDSPEELMVKGYDVEGNVFSSLRGLEFKWTLHSDNTAGSDDLVDANSILRILKFSESHYTMPLHIDQLEERGRQGDIILVEGVRTGSAIVWAKLRDPVYESVSHSQVRLMVIANLIVSPSEAYVLKYATVKYKVEQIRQNSIVEIKMPSSQFFLEVVNSMISSLDAATSIATAQELGETEIKLIDKNIKTSDALGQPTAMLHVVNPSYLAFVVLPDKKWVLQTNRVYEVLIEVYDKNSHKIFPSDNVIIEAMFPSKYFEVLSSTKNGTYHVVRTLQKGDTDIDGMLATIIREDRSEFKVSPALKHSQFVEIFDPIVVRPELLFFPWDVISQTFHTYQLKAEGGSGEYVWSSDNTEKVTVNKHGEIRTAMRGEAIVTAADRRNQQHKGLAEVHILPPTAMEFQPDRVEVQIGDVLDLPLNVQTNYGGRKVSFNDCRNMPLNISFGDPSIVNYVEGHISLKEGSCRIVRVKGILQGHTKVIASYSMGGVKLETMVTIATYEPLVPIDPEKESVVSVGSAKEVIFSGGPQPWVLDSSKYFQRLTAGESKNVLIEPVNSIGTQKRYHSFFVTCKNFGEQTLTLVVGNEKTAKNTNPAVEEGSVNFVCGEPVEVHLLPQVTYPQGLPPCPVAREPNQPVPVHCEPDLDIAVVVTDINGRRFDNISSLEFDWSLSDSNLATFLREAHMETDVTVATTGRKTVMDFVVLRPHGIPDSLVVKAAVTKYKAEYLQRAKSAVSERISPRISKSVELQLVEEAEISPTTVAVFNHPSNQVTVSVKKGSGYFHVHEERGGVVELKYMDKKHQIQMAPLRDGQLTVTVYDLCIDLPRPATVSVTVSGVGSVHLSVMDKVEVGKEVTARVQVFDVSGNRLFASFFPLMGLQLEPASDFISVKPDPQGYGDEYTATYTVHGAMVGHTSLKAVTHVADGRTIASHAKPVEVFPPLELLPRNITLIIGALFQVLSRGGPMPQCTVVFSIKDSQIASVSGSGLLHAAKLGSTNVIGQAVGQDPDTGETVIYSQDEVIVNVVRLVGIRIHAPLTRLQTQTTMPLYAVGLTEHETPFTFGSALPSLSFHWSVNKKDVARLQSVHHQSGISPQADGNFAVQMVAMETGHVSVRLEVKPNPGHNQIVGDSVLTDEIQIQVFTELGMVSPQVCDGELLMTPNTEASLRTNRDGAAKMSYTVQSTTSRSTTDVVRVVDGLLVSGPLTGQAAIQVTAVEEFGLNQTLVILVKVKPVSYMMINSDTTLRAAGTTLNTVPRGTTLHITVTYHDDVGKTFFATNVDLKYRCSRYDLVQVLHGLENNTLIMKTAAVGHTTLKVWDKHKPWLVDYVGIPVDNAIQPAVPAVTLGDIICFTVPILSNNGLTGGWRATNSISVNKQQGIATATGTGTGAVVYAVGEEVLTEMDVFVEQIRSVRLEPQSDYITMTTDPNKHFNFLVSLSDHQVQASNCLSAIAEEGYQPNRVPFTCKLDVESANQEVHTMELFTVKGVFVSKKGKYVCQVSPVSFSPDVRVSTLIARVRVQATVQEVKGQPEVSSAAVVIPFLPPFYLHHGEVHLSTLSPLGSIKVSAIPDIFQYIKVVVSDTSILESLAPEKDPHSSTGLLYPIKMIDTVLLWEREQLDVWVDLVCQKTGQKVKVPVYIRLIGQKPDLSGVRYHGDAGWRSLFLTLLNNYQFLFVILVIVVLTIFSALFAYHALYGPSYKTSAPSGGSPIMSPAGASPMAPPYSPGATPPAYNYYPIQTPKSPMLWSTGYTPLDGSPTRRRSPIQRISPS